MDSFDSVSGSCRPVVIVSSRAIWAVLLTRCSKLGVMDDVGDGGNGVASDAGWGATEAPSVVLCVGGTEVSCC